MSWLNYDENKANEATGGNFEPIPVDTELPVRISDAVARDTRTGGKMVQLTLTVVSGKHKSRKIWHNLHIQCKSEAMSHRDRRTLQDIAKIVHADISAGPAALVNLKGRDLLCRVTEHEQDEYNGKVTIKERVGNFRTDPEARNTASDIDDDSIPF